jgi:hypothetical protein
MDTSIIHIKHFSEAKKGLSFFDIIEEHHPQQPRILGETRSRRSD